MRPLETCLSHPQALRSLCYKNEMKSPVRNSCQWLLFRYVGGEFTPLSKPFKTRQAAERARAKLAKKEQRSTAIGLLRSKQ